MESHAKTEKSLGALFTLHERDLEKKKENRKKIRTPERQWG